MNALLNELSKHHKEWIKIVRSFGESNYTEDIVQEMYIRADKYIKLEKIMPDGKLNKSFIWLMLRNIYLDAVKNKNRVEKVSLTQYTFVAEPTETIKHESYKKLYAKMNAEIDSWHWYDKMLFQYYRDSGMSLRQLSAAKKISTRSIFYTIKICKQRLLESVGEDYQDYLNNDFELI